MSQVDFTLPNGCELLLLEGQAIGTFTYSRIHFVSADLDGIQRTIICAAAMMFTLLYGTLNCFVFIISIHDQYLLFKYSNSMARWLEIIRGIELKNKKIKPRIYNPRFEIISNTLYYPDQ